MRILNPQCSAEFEETQISYAEIEKKTDQVYRKLRETGLQDNKKIALYLDRDVSMLYAISAILATNSLYIPIDTNLPDERVSYMLESSKADFILTNEKYKDKFSGKKTLCIEAVLYDNVIADTLEFPNKMGEGLAYILFTSGTSGNPKSVLISKKALINFMQGTTDIIDFSGCTSIVCLTTISFDIFFLESIFALNRGLKVFMTNYSEQQNPRKLIRILKENCVDTMQVTPSKLRQLYAMDQELKCLSHLKVIVVGGEAFPAYLLEVLQKKTEAVIFNAYGPTEATIWISYSCLNGKTRIDIGDPMTNNSFYIVNEEGNMTPDGEIGELCISGANLADGYYNDPEMTEEKFSLLRISKDSEIRVYKTGDLCMKDNRSNFICLGRKDNQVKINGFRIELEEIEKCITNCMGIFNAVAYCEQTDQASSKALICLYCGEKKSEKELKMWAMNYLPAYMIPQKLVWIPEFDYTIGGKADRKKMFDKYQHLWK